MHCSYSQPHLIGFNLGRSSSDNDSKLPPSSVQCHVLWGQLENETLFAFTICRIATFILINSSFLMYAFTQLHQNTCVWHLKPSNNFSLVSLVCYPHCLLLSVLDISLSLSALPKGSVLNIAPDDEVLNEYPLL